MCCCRAVNQITIILRNKLPITHYHNNDDTINYYWIKIRLQVMMEVCRFGCVPMGFFSGTTLLFAELGRRITNANMIAVTPSFVLN